MATQALPSYLTASTLTTVIGGVTQTQVETVVVTSVLPTQQLPTFLSASTFTTTVNGIQTTGTTLVELPLTYIGPSIPLGTNGVWTFLGSTTPASLTSTQASSSSTAIPSSSTSSTQTSSSSASSTSALTSTSSSSSLSASNTSSSGSTSTESTESSPSSTISSNSPPSSSSAAPAAVGAAHHLSTNQILAISLSVVIAALVAIMLIVLFCYRKRRRRQYEHPNLSDFVLVESEGEGTRYAGEGSPRPTGEEGDSLLRGSLTTTNDEMREIGPTARLVNNPSPTGSERTTGTALAPEGVIPSAYKTPSSSPTPTLGPKLPSPFFHASASSLFFNPTRGPDRSLIGATMGSTKRDSASTNDSSTSSPVSPAPTRNIIPPHQLLQMDDEWRQESLAGGFGIVALHHGPSEIGERMHEGTPLRPPPALGYGHETASSRHQDSFLNSMRSMGSHADSPGSDDDERATLLMAHRFNMNEGGGPTVLLHPGNSTATETTTPSSWHSSLGQGLQGLNVRLSRLSWFQRMDANRTHSPGSALPTTATTRTRSGSPLRSVGTRSSLVVPPRPVSNLTTSSTGDTLFFDAPSGPSTQSTREGSRSRNGNGNGNGLGNGHRHAGSFGQRPTSMPPLPPRAMVTPTGAPAAANSAPQTPHPGYDNGSDGGSSFNQPALLFLDNYSASSAPGSPRLRFSTPPPIPSLPQPQPQVQATPVAAAVPAARARPRAEPIIDILDTPVPARAAVSPFSTTSTRGGPAVPPGLDIANIRSWRESSSDMPSSATFGSRSDHASGSEVIGGGGGDVLEEAPPLPRANWMQMRAVTVASTIDSNRTRRALGQSDASDPYDDVHSSAGSLHSIPDRLSHLSPMGSGSNSRAPSRQYNSSSLGSNSNSSHHSLGPSPLGAHGDNGTGNGTSGSSGSNLAHSNSITSDGQRRPRREPGEPLGLSPANSEYFRRARLSAIGGHRTPIGTPQRSPAADATFVQGVASGFNGESASAGAGTGALLGRTT